MGPFWIHKGELSSGILNSPQTNIFSLLQANETIEDFSPILSVAFTAWAREWSLQAEMVSLQLLFLIQQLTTLVERPTELFSSVEDAGKRKIIAESFCVDISNPLWGIKMSDLNINFLYTWMMERDKKQWIPNELLMNISWCYGTTLNITRSGFRSNLIIYSS